MSELVIETKGLTKKYHDFIAVDNLDLSVKQGEVFGLLGPNGAGKTTTILMLLGLTEPSGGKVRVLGLNPARKPLSVKAHVGYLPELIGFYEELTAFENLIYTAKLNGISRQEANRRIEDALSLVGLGEVVSKQVGTFSRGMRQRLGLADVMIKQPGLIIMDEPTQGLDPEGAREFLQMVSGLKQEGITIVLSSHLLFQVQVICDRVGLFHRGKMVLEGTVPELARKVLGKAYRIYLVANGPDPVILETLHGLPGVVNVTRLNDHSYEVQAEHDLRAEAAKAVIEAGVRLLKLDAETQSLEDIYAEYFKEVGHVNPAG
jgi:ABC-2 type transport system ATP-binding protein